MLSGALIHKASCRLMLERLRAGDFFQDGHRLLFDAIAALAERGEAVDPVTLKEELKQRDQLDAVGGPQAPLLLGLIEEGVHFSRFNMPSYIRIVRDLSIKRVMIRLGLDIVRDAQNGTSAEALLASADERLSPLRQPEASPETDHPVDALSLLHHTFDETPAIVGHGIIPCASFVVLGGAPKLGKSVSTLNLAIARATGQQWLEFPTSPGRTLILQAEIGEAALQERLDIMLKGVATPLPPKTLFVKTARGLRLDQPDGLAEMRRAIERVNPDLVIIDPLARFMAGDENSTRDMNTVVAAMDQLIEAYGITVLLVHHLKKPGETERRGGDQLRGSSALFAAADAVILLHREDGGIRVSAELRHGPEPKPRTLELTPTLWLGPPGPPQELLDVAAIVSRVPMGWSLLKKAIIADKLATSERTAERLIRTATKAGLLTKTEDGLYIATATNRHADDGGKESSSE